jgi:hypothetical protein
LDTKDEDRFMQMLMNDSLFLKQHGVMDYSLFLVVEGSF